MVLSLWLPILLSSVALFFASFLSWMVLQLHRQDWIKIEREDDFMGSVRQLNIPVGSYMFPCPMTMEEMKSEAMKQKMEEGPRGVLTVFPRTSMGTNLVWTFLFFLGVSFCLAYLATLGLDPGAKPFDVFRFFATAGLITFPAAMIQHAIWFRCRIVGHLIESLAYALIIGGIFAALWPAASS